MTILFVILPLAIALSALAVLAFLWATFKGQLDDLETPAVRLLCDELREPVRSAAQGQAAAPDGEPKNPSRVAPVRAGR